MDTLFAVLTWGCLVSAFIIWLVIKSGDTDV